MSLTKEDLTKVPIIEKQPLILCLSYLSMIKDRNEQQRREMEKMKNRNRWSSQ